MNREHRTKETTQEALDLRKMATKTRTKRSVVQLVAMNENQALYLDALEHKSQVVHMVDKYQMDVPVIEFTVDDIIRSKVCKEWIIAFNNYERI